MKYRVAICVTALACLGTMVSASFAKTASSRATAIDRLRAVKARLQIDRKTRRVSKVMLRSGTKVDSNLIDALKRFPGIEFLDLSATVPNGGGYAWIGKLAKLRTLKMNGLNADDDDLAFLLTLRRLEHLEVRKNRLSEPFVRKLGEHPALKEVDISAGKIPEERLRRIEDDLDQLVFLRQWTIEMKEDVFRMRVNTPVADFIFEGAAAPKDYQQTISVPISGTRSFRKQCRFKKNLHRWDARVTRRGNYVVKMDMGTLDTFEISGDGKTLTFKERSYDLTRQNQTIFISADEKGVFSKHRTEAFALLPEAMDGQLFKPSRVDAPFMGFHVVDAKGKQRTDKAAGKRKYKPGGYKEPTGLGPCILAGIDFKGQVAMVITEWSDDIMDNPPGDQDLKGKPTGRGITIVYEGIPRGGRTNRIISTRPIGFDGESAGLALGASRARVGKMWRGGIVGYDLTPIECSYDAGVCRIRWAQCPSTLEFVDRGRTLRVREIINVDKLPDVFKALNASVIPGAGVGIQPLSEKDIVSGRVLFEQEVSPKTKKPLFMVDRDGRLRRVKK